MLLSLVLVMPVLTTQVAVLASLKKLKTDPKLDMISEDSFKLYQTKMAKKEI